MVPNRQEMRTDRILVPIRRIRTLYSRPVGYIRMHSCQHRVHHHKQQLGLIHDNRIGCCKCSPYLPQRSTGRPDTMVAWSHCDLHLCSTVDLQLHSRANWAVGRCRHTTAGCMYRSTGPMLSISGRTIGYQTLRIRKPEICEDGRRFSYPLEGNTVWYLFAIGSAHLWGGAGTRADH